MAGLADAPIPIRSTAIVRWPLATYGMTFRQQPWSVWADADALAKVNPLRRVPVLVLGDGTALIESAAILDWLDDRIEGCKNPRHFGEALKGGRAGLWRYRVGDYRIICHIRAEVLFVLALAVGHRRDIYPDR